MLDPGPTPVNVKVLKALLRGYDVQKCNYLIQGFVNGFHIGFTGEHEAKFSTNHPSVLLNKDLVSTKIQTELSLGRIGGPLDRPPCPGFRVSPLGLVPKKEPGKFRLIHDLSYPKFRLGQSVNSNIEGEYSVVSYDDLDFAISLIQHYGQGAQVAKMDIESAYRIIPIHPTDYKLLGFTWEGRYYFDRCLPMGCSSSCQIFEAFSTALQWIAMEKFSISPMSHILDDFMFFGPPNSPQCSQHLTKFLQLCTSLQIPLNQSKTVLATSTVILHGIHVDTVNLTASLPVDKVQSLKTSIQSVSKCKSVTLERLQSIIGSMNFASKVVIPGRAFSRRLIDLTKGVTKSHHHIHLNKEARADLAAWQAFLDDFNGSYLFINQRWLSSDKISLYTDSAASYGYAAVYGSNWVNGSWPHPWDKFHITILELYPILLALELWGSQLANHSVLFLCDNEAVVHIINKQSSKEPKVMVLVRQLVLCTLKFNLLVKAKHLPGKLNIIADKLSRFQVREARLAAPWLAEVPVVPPPHLLPSSIL